MKKLTTDHSYNITLPQKECTECVIAERANYSV